METKTSVVSEKPKIGLADNYMDEVVKILNTLLADEYILYTKTRNYHWNVVGPQFSELHEFFGKQYGKLDGIVDEVAERARQLGGKSVATLVEFSRNARIKEQPNEYPDAQTMIFNLLNDHEAVIRNLRVDADVVADKYHDTGTNDFLIGLVEQREKMAWMLRSFLIGKRI